MIDHPRDGWLWSSASDGRLRSTLGYEDKAQLDRIEAMLKDLTSLPHNKRPEHTEDARMDYWSGAFGEKVVRLEVRGRGVDGRFSIRADLAGGAQHEVTGATVDGAWEALFDVASRVREGAAA